MTDPFWEVGFAHNAGEHLSAQFAIGERSFGSSWRGSVDYAFRRGSVTLTYAETPTTTGFSRTDLVFDPTDIDDLVDFDDFLNAPGGAERFLQQRLQLGMNLAFRRSGLNIVLFDEDRTGRTNADGTLLGDQSQTGARVDFNWQAGPRTAFEAWGSIADREFDIGSESRFVGAGLRVNYTIGSRTELAISYGYTDQQPRGAGAGPTGRDYVANVVSLLFTFTI